MVMAPRMRAYATLAITFALGVAAGGGGVYAALRREQAHPPGPERDPNRYINLLTTRLGLSPEQRVTINAMIERARDARRQERTRTDGEIRAQLTPAQQARFDELIRERDRAFGAPAASSR